MKKCLGRYFALANASLQRSMAYRFSFFTSFLADAVRTLVMLMVWIAVFRQRSTVAVCVLSACKRALPFSIVSILYWVLAVACGTPICFSLNLLMATLSFWVVDSQSAMVMVQNVSDFAKYPVSIYGKGLRIILTFVLPYAFCSYYPSVFLLRMNAEPLYWLAPPIAASALLAAACLLWRVALSGYQSGGG